MPGSVLFHAPAPVFQAPGGGENQLVQTGRNLEALGVPVRLFSTWTDKLEDFRLLHLFGMSRESLELARVAKARGLSVVLSPICWYEPRALLALSPGPTEAVKSLAGWVVRRAAPRVRSWRGELLRLADAVLPNSRAEADQLVSLFGLDRSVVRVVPNGVDPRFALSSDREFRDRFGDEEFVLYVGRIEPRKNVLGLVEACRSLGHRLVVIGDCPPGQAEYFEKCVTLGGDTVTWIGGLDHEATLLASAYASARVFALPSWFETPGLSALEAALAGCAMVVTPYGCTREYFEHRALYARPDRPNELSQAIATAWRDGANPSLARHVAEHFFWSEVARKTAEVYDEVAG
jgi:glycosyltransferase involved in cell wall biosynthesis